MPTARLATWLVVPFCLYISACSETIVKDVPTTDTIQDVNAEQNQSTVDTQTPGLPATNPMVAEPAGANTVTADPDTVNMVDESDEPIQLPNNMPSLENETEQTELTASTADPIDTNASEPDSIDTTAGEPDEQEMTMPTDQELADPSFEEMETETGNTAQSIDLQTDIANPEMVVGAPGAAVDCERSLPCRWLSDDLQFSVTVTNADNIASLGKLSIQFSINTLHDSQVSIARPDQAIDVADELFEPEGQVLGEGNGVTAQSIIAGSALNGNVSFDKASSTKQVALWSITLLDAGMIRNASFNNLPIGSATSEFADCRNVLPCVWESPDQDVTITLLSVGNLSTGNRLTANFTLTTSSDATVAVDAGSSAVGMDGTQFSGRTHSLAGRTSFEKLTATTPSSAPLAGSFFFYRTESTPEFLQDLSLIIYNDEPIPRWNPRFASVPIL